MNQKFDDMNDLTSTEAGDITSELDSTSNNITGFNKNRARRTHAYRKLEKKYHRVRNLSLIVIASLLAVGMLSYTAFKRVSDENRDLQFKLSESERQNKVLLDEMKLIQVENDSLVQGRIPGLTPIKFDEPFKLNETLKSIIFTRTEHNGQVSYEYLAVVQNLTNDVIRPASLLLLFDKSGVEIGRSYIAISKTFGDRSELIALQPGESHSFSGNIDLSNKSIKPAFFKLIQQN